VNPYDAQAIRQRALIALSNNRIPGYHFGGHFVDLHCPCYSTDGVVMEMDSGPHNTNADGTTHLAAMLFLADMALSSSCRVFVDPTRRTATLSIEVRFTGEQARGRLRAETRSEGFSERTALAQAHCTGRVLAQGREIIRTSGTWVAPPAPPGRTLYPLPWEPGYAGAAVSVLKPKELDAAERGVVRRVERALREAEHGAFMRSLWDPKVRHTPKGATSRLPVGMYVGNRVGHVQGGFTLNTAIATAVAAVPHHPILTAVSAWYISPGQGRALHSRATVLQKGRNVAVVRTEVFATGGARVLEAISNHAIAAK
jgi:acyl-coenzyme A thioesterase PaaI-like protein